MSGDASSNPFPGPQPYRAADRAHFFGREDLSRRLLNRILADPCVTLFGPSGAGKSSLMQASVIPLLMEQEGFRVVLIDGWLAGEAPLERLVQSMFEQLELGAPPEGLHPRELLDEALRLAERRSERPILIFLDQLEQPLLPGRPWEQLHELLEGLETLALAPLRGLQLVLSLREDYLGRFRDQVRGIRVLQDPGFRLGPLTVKEMTQVACATLCSGAPSRKWSFEELRVLMLQVRTAGQSATDEAEVQAAFAQIVCRTIWEEQGRREGMTGPVQAEPILHRYLDTTLDSLGPLRSAAVKLMEEHLVARDGSRTLLTQREAEEVLPAGAAAQVLDSLEKAAILHAEQHQGGRYFELGHDWLAKKVLEFKREQEETLRLQEERVARRKLVTYTTAASAAALVLLVLFIWGLKARAQAEANAELASNMTLLAGAREQMQRGQPALATKLLAEVKNPEKIEQAWETLAQEALDSNLLEVTLQAPSGESFNAASFSPDGQHIVTASDDGIARVWRTANSGAPRLLSGHAGPVTAAEFSPDGKRIITASVDGTARVWSLEDEALLRVLEHKEKDKDKDSVRSASFSPDGQRIVTVFNGSAWVWWTDNPGKPIQKLSLGDDKRINFAAFSPDPKVPRIVTASLDGTAQVWRADDRGPVSLLQQLEGHEDSVTAATFSPDGQRIVTASLDGTARMWRRAKGPAHSFMLDQKLVGHEGPIKSAAFSPTGRFIVTGSHDGTARVWRVQDSGSAVMIRVLERHMGPVTAVTAFDTSGEEEEDLRVATASQDGTARVWHADLGNQPVVTGVLEHKELVTDAGFSPDGMSIVTASQDGVARVWRADNSEPPIELKGHEDRLTSAAFSPDPKDPRIVTTSRDKTARVWKKRADGWRQSASFPHPVTVQSAAFSPDGKSIVTASQDGVARVWPTDGDGSKPPIELDGLEDPRPLTSAAFSRDLEDPRIVTTSRDKTARVWKKRADGWKQSASFPHPATVQSAAFSPDGKSIITTSQDGVARIWRADGSGQSADKPLRELPNKGPIQSAMFSPGGESIVTTSWDATARVWRFDDLGPPRVMNVLKGHEGPVRSAAFSPDQNVQRIVTVSWDRTVRIWRLPKPGPEPEPKFLRQQLEEWNRDCLPSAMRQTYLKEDEQEARGAYKQCEREHHRDPS